MTLEAFTESGSDSRPQATGGTITLPGVTGQLPTAAVRPRGRTRLGRLLSLPAEVLAACLAGVGTVAMAEYAPEGSGGQWAALLGLAVWVMVVYHQEHGCAVPLQAGLWAPVRGVLAVMGLAGVLVATDREPPRSLPVVLATTLAAAATALCWRVLRSRRAVTALLVAEPAAVVDLTSTGRRARLDVRAIFALGDNGSTGEELLAEVRQAAAEERVDVVVVVPGGPLAPELARQLGWALEIDGVHLLVTQAAPTVAPHRLRPVRVAGHTLISVLPSHRPLWVRAVKSLLDRVLGLALLAFSAPLLLVLATLVRLDSPGPALFKQQRIGRGGAPFTMYKLRTMRCDAEQLRVPLQRQQGDRMLFKMVEDPRVTRIGRFLRRSSLDELPQLLNVVRGDMSLVGPRPALPEEVARYDARALRRLDSKPGVSGLWQVSGRSDLDWDESLALDLHYVDNARLVDDVLILARTLHAVMASKGAY